MKNIQDIIIEYGQKLMDIGFSIGNSPRILVKEGINVYATRAGSDFGNLSPQDIEEIGAGADPYKGAMIERDYGALIISQPEYATMCVQDGLAIPAVLEDMAMIVGPKVPIVPGDRFGIAKGLKQSAAVITAEGSLVTCGRNLYEAMTCLMVLEKNAEIFIDADFLGGAKSVNPIIAKLENLIYHQKYSKNEIARQDMLESGNEVQEIPEEIPADILRDVAADFTDWDNWDNQPAFGQEKAGDPEEKHKRELVVEYGKKLVETGLVQGTWGNLSLRLNDQYMLCTPSGRDYAGIKPEEIVKVNINTLEYGGNIKPTSEKDFHAGIYRLRPDVNGIIHTHSKFACVFAACGLSFKTSGGDVIECAAYGPSGTGILSKNVQNAIGENKGCLMRNHGMVAVGKDLPESFQNALNIENAAKMRIEQFWK